MIVVCHVGCGLCRSDSKTKIDIQSEFIPSRRYFFSPETIAYAILSYHQKRQLARAHGESQRMNKA
jgi:hypothetical protein